MDFVDFKEPIQPTDVPIKPGEKYVLKIPQQLMEGWEAFASHRNLPKSEPKKITMIFQQINFGDGTGFSGTGAVPIPNKQASKFSCDDKTKNSQAAFIIANDITNGILD
jgi:hypothetical protein